MHTLFVVLFLALVVGNIGATLIIRRLSREYRELAEQTLELCDNADLLCDRYDEVVENIDDRISASFWDGVKAGESLSKYRTGLRAVRS